MWVPPRLVGSAAAALPPLLRFRFSEKSLKPTGCNLILLLLSQRQQGFESEGIYTGVSISPDSWGNGQIHKGLHAFTAMLAGGRSLSPDLLRSCPATAEHAIRNSQLGGTCPKVLANVYEPVID
ncbi:hypothetical protein WJX77_004949 [Trebouxia sp. C0004]